MTTDSAFSSLGVNAIVIAAFNKILNEKGYKFGDVFLSVPVIIDFDTLIKLGYMLSIKDGKILSLKIAVFLLCI